VAAASAASGVLLLDKPAGYSSTQALARAKRFLGATKAGHTGTLDPFATGLLPLAFGEATKFSRFLIDADKGYEATLRLGERTATGDIEGEVIERREVRVTPGQVDAVLARFLGPQTQLPPMHSAVRVNGRRLYDYARAGETVERAARDVRIERLTRIALEGAELRLAVTCSKGTYVRTLAMDIGEALGCGAHLTALRRTATGPFRLEQACSLAALEAEGTAGRARLLPPEALVEGLPRAALSAEEARRFSHGQAVALAAAAPGSEWALFSPDARFLGVGRANAGGILDPQRLMSPPDAEAP
jgi:tRNA pseudouridine55 synthase